MQPDAKNELGYIILMTDEVSNFNIVHYDSNSFNHIEWSVMFTENQALTLIFDFSFIFKYLMEAIMGRNTRIEALGGSKTAINVVYPDGKQLNEVCRLIYFPPSELRSITAISH